MNDSVLYVLAGPNGIGKTTSSFSVLPQNLPIISSDEIAKQVQAAGIVSVSTQEYSNREAQKLVQHHLEARKSFGIETNLSDEETWKFLKGTKASGYKVHLAFLCTDDIDILHNRIAERARRGEHFVRPDIVEERYYTSLKLLNHYLPLPDVVHLIDNSRLLLPVASKVDDNYRVLQAPSPAWFTQHLAAHFSAAEKPAVVQNLETVEAVRKRYREGM